MENKKEMKFIEKSAEGLRQKKKTDYITKSPTPGKDPESYLLITPRSTIKKNGHLIDRLYVESLVKQPFFDERIKAAENKMLNFHNKKGLSISPFNNVNISGDNELNVNEPMIKFENGITKKKLVFLDDNHNEHLRSLKEELKLSQLSKEFRKSPYSNNDNNQPKNLQILDFSNVIHDKIKDDENDNISVRSVNVVKSATKDFVDEGKNDHSSIEFLKKSLDVTNKKTKITDISSEFNPFLPGEINKVSPNTIFRSLILNQSKNKFYIEENKNSKTKHVSEISNNIISSESQDHLEHKQENQNDNKCSNKNQDKFEIKGILTYEEITDSETGRFLNEKINMHEEGSKNSSEIDLFQQIDIEKISNIESVENPQLEQKLIDENIFRSSQSFKKCREEIKLSDDKKIEKK